MYSKKEYNLFSQIGQTSNYNQGLVDNHRNGSVERAKNRLQRKMMIGKLHDVTRKLIV